MSQEDRAMPAGSLREDPFVFLEQQRSCRCSTVPSAINSSQNPENASQSSLELPDGNAFVIEIQETTSESHHQQHQHQQQHEQPKNLGDPIIDRFSGLRSSVVDLQQMSGTQSTHGNTGTNFPHELDKRFVHGNKKTTNRGTNKYPGNDVTENIGCSVVDTDSSGMQVEQQQQQQQHQIGQQVSDQRGHPSIGSSQIVVHARSPVQQQQQQQQITDIAVTHCDENSVQERGTIDQPGSLSDRATSPVRNDDRPSTATSTASFSTTSCSSNDPNNARLNSRLDVHANEAHNRSQGSNIHHQLPVMNAFNANRSNIRLTRDNNKNNVDGTGDIEDINRITPTPTTIGHPGFHNLHPEHILQPIHRQTNVSSKGAFDTIQVSAGNTMEKGKCQCHHIQQHQHQHQQQRISHIQQRDQQIHQHHHHQHRHKLMQQQQQQHPRSQQQQQQQQQQQSQHYRHHHYHHPHQHLGQQQQDHQRQQNDSLVMRNKRGTAGADDDSDEITETNTGIHQPPALPPRPPPRPNRRYEQNSLTAYDIGPNGEDTGCCKKYVILCCLCGGLSATVGSFFLAVHAVLSAHTTSLALFETVPSYIPGTMLILMGLFTILLSRRKHRYGFLIKTCGSVGVVCALVCVLVTVTTTVVHMSRIQSLRECMFSKRARSCTCYGSPHSKGLDPGVVFEGLPHCEAVHGALYDCLRALFGVSVAGILACIFSCMLLYQLVSHEKKKMYWEQLQLRCRSLYGQGGSGAVGTATGGSCGCCNDCNGASPWWAQTPGNLYTPNPDLAPFSRRWRLPWSRSRGPAPTPDSNYGFHAQSRGTVVMRSSSSSADAGENTPGPYSVLADESQASGAPYSLLNGSNPAPYTGCTSSVASYSLLENGALPAVWGPPPPYSDPNSPARRPQLTEERRSTPPSRLPPPNTSAVSAVPVTRIGNKRTTDNFDGSNCEEFRQRGTAKRPSDNYENTEEILSSSTDPDIEMGGLHQTHQHHHHHHHQQQQQQQQQPQQQQLQQQQHQQHQHQQDEDTVKGRRIRKSLKGVENGAFQQDAGNAMSKQSESELYFGDVSSCCGPESSFYDLAVEKEQQSSTNDPSDNMLEYPTTNRLGKQRQPSKRSRLPLPLPTLGSEASVGSLTDNYAALNNTVVAGEDVTRNSSTRGPFLAPDAQYEVIAQQTRYTYYNAKNGEHVLEIPLPSLASLAYHNNSKEQIDEIDGPTSADYLNDCQRITEHCSNEGAVGTISIPPSPSPSASSSPSTSSSSSSRSPPSPRSPALTAIQRCQAETSANPRDSGWQIDPGHSQSSEGVCPVNV